MTQEAAKFHRLTGRYPLDAQVQRFDRLLAIQWRFRHYHSAPMTAPASYRLNCALNACVAASLSTVVKTRAPHRRAMAPTNGWRFLDCSIARLTRLAGIWLGSQRRLGTARGGSSSLAPVLTQLGQSVQYRSLRAERNRGWNSLPMFHTSHSIARTVNTTPLQRVNGWWYPARRSFLFSFNERHPDTW